MFTRLVFFFPFFFYFFLFLVLIRVSDKVYHKVIR